eukprot:CAMPEP_0185579144 /NCGR_PEP_ID=MMETSP0434-20130131/13716_1 /TAXON_ID=626734 ORGANISM="Favella taraikaensis, Strain Fe Narragansett Bay" /NCGR_SAMPLE_ID=MMETSP0434 /ASSEMBLY_ACC=CAM_ASM_000379 /LENGTH=168 /DNA_ID=CAMNT_0028197105 /DNA_START=578 /DNA_END=1086 /DNA_ORIENTATION=-
MGAGLAPVVQNSRLEKTVSTGQTHSSLQRSPCSHFALRGLQLLITKAMPFSMWGVILFGSRGSRPLGRDCVLPKNSSRVSNKVVIILVVVDADIERLEGVDVELLTWAVALSDACALNIDLALALEVTRLGREVTEFVGSVAGVDGRVEAPVVSLHDVELRATLAAIL